MGTTADYVSLPPSADIDQFRKAVKAECSNKLKSSCKLNGLGETEEDALIVAVPYMTSLQGNS